MDYTAIYLGVNNMPKKKLLTVTIYEDIDEPYHVELLEQHLTTINQTELYEAIRDVIAMRLQVNQDKILQQMREKGALKIQ